MRRRVAIGFLGTTLDMGRGGRWQRWRPTVALCQQPDLFIDRLELIHGTGSAAGLAAQVTADIGDVSPATEVRSHVIDFKDPWDFSEVYTSLHAFARGYAFDPDREDYLVNITTGTHVAQICLFLLNESHHLPGILIQTQPTKRGTAKGSYNLIDLDLSRYDLLAKRFAEEQTNDVAFLKSGIATKNKQFNKLIDTIERVAIRSDEPILLTGPTGAGKSQLAKRIFELKKLNHQVKGNFVDVNCATLRGDQAMSALFGHKKGSFTGAVADRPGLLKAADGGILFLDEIGELGLDEQAMLLRAIEEKTFLPLGSDKEETSSFQLICGTNQDLESAVAQGTFRADLLARIDLWNFSLPGLADRREDIEPNLEYELARFAKKSGKHITFNAEAKKCFLEYALDPATDWHGNFRDLNAMIIRMATLSSGGRIDLETVREELSRSRKTRLVETQPDLADLLGPDYAERFDYFELAQLREVVKVCRASRSLADAGKKLFAVSRKAKKSSNDSDRLSKYLAHFGIDFHEIIKGKIGQ